MAYAKLMPRRGTQLDWHAINPILEEGEFVIEVPASGVGTGLSKVKIGDGTNRYINLPYAFDGAAASSIDGGDAVTSHLIKLRTDSQSNWEARNPILNEGEPGFDTTSQAIKIGVKDQNTGNPKSWNNLDYLHALKISSYKTSPTSTVMDNVLDTDVLLDFGDEDLISVSGMENTLEDNSRYPESVFDPSLPGVQSVPLSSSKKDKEAGLIDLISELSENDDFGDEDLSGSTILDDSTDN